MPKHVTSADLPLNARDHGVKADGATNDRAAVVAAITAAAAGNKTVLLPPGKIKNTGAIIPVPDGVTIAGRGAKVTVWDGPGFHVGSAVAIRDMTLDGTNSGGSNAVLSNTATTDVRVENCEIINWSVAVYFAAAGGNLGATRFKVRGNHFGANGYAVLIEVGYDGRVESNTSVNAAATGRHFIFYSGKGLRFLNNDTEGGIVGIGGFASRQVVSGKLITGCIISGNRISNISEEGISFDVIGSTADIIGVLDWGTVTATSFNATTKVLKVTLDSLFNTAPQHQFSQYKMVVTTGAAAGTVLNIGASNGAVLDLYDVRDSVFPKIANGDEIVIGIPSLGNIVTNNTLIDCHDALVVWGFGVSNVIEGNVVEITGPDRRDGIAVRGLDGLIKSTRNISGRFGRAPSINNVVRNNILRNADLHFSVFKFGASPGYPMLGNVKTDNTLINGDDISVTA